MFYDTHELGDVAIGIKQPWEPQPYAFLEIDDRLFSVESEQQKYHVNSACFDAERGILYVFEHMADGNKPIIHVWTLNLDSDPTSGNVKKVTIRR